MKRTFPAVKLIAGCVAAGALLVSYFWFREPDTGLDSVAPASEADAGSRSAWHQFLADNFAGDAACAECHAEEYAAHQRSGHAHTATLMAESDLAERLAGTVYDDPRRGQRFRFEQTDAVAGKPAAFHVTEDGVPDPAPFPAQWLLGSGAHARTPVSIDTASGYGVEFRWSWFANTAEVSVTPDHERFDDFRPHSLECFGRPLDPEQARACVGCHMTAVPPLGVAPAVDTYIANVGCERCHGPRKEHVELAHQGRAAEAPPLIRYDDPAVYMQQCAQCHRDEHNIPPDSPPNVLARFQPYGLLRSRCYLASPEELTCSACHDPHDRVSTDRQTYLTACRDCHDGPEQTHCSLQPAGDCVACHMPAVEWHSGIAFHDHWIRIPDRAGDVSKQPTGPALPGGPSP